MSCFLRLPVEFGISTSVDLINTLRVLRKSRHTGVIVSNAERGQLSSMHRIAKSDTACPPLTRSSQIDTMTKAKFNASKAYAPKEEEGTAFFDDGREIELLHFVYSHPDLESIRGSPKNVLKAIDEYGRTKKYLMNVGEDKGGIVCDLIADVKPHVMVRLPIQTDFRAHCPLRSNSEATSDIPVSYSATQSGNQAGSDTTA